MEERDEQMQHRGVSKGHLSRIERLVNAVHEGRGGKSLQSLLLDRVRELIYAKWSFSNE
jgi:hypothetical protein